MLITTLAAGTWDHFAAGFGVTAAILAVGGIILLRFQRNRHEFALMQAALEKGITSLATAQPPWIVSLRQGLMTLTLGIGLLGVGAAAWRLAEKVEFPETSAMLAAADKPRDDQNRLKPEARLYTVARNRWERSQTQRVVGLALAGSGAVLVLLGAVRVAFSHVEKKHLAEPAPIDE